ncbi:MAG: sigma-70 family RNA polymerase sigma factor [Sediminibacterium sp.]|nr:sigma-70 family RNA polymerase sigma factor [Sediminibacterium sp.]
MNTIDTIIAGCKNNEPAAREALFRKYAGLLMGVAMRYMKEREDAEDLVQDAFVTIFLKIHQYRGSGSFEGWIKLITAHKAIKLLKRKQKLQSLSVYEKETADVEEEDEPYLSDDITPQFLAECIKKLPDGYRTILNLHLFENLPHKEIADKVGIKESTSRSQYMKARRLLIKIIQEQKKETWTQKKEIMIF